MKCSNFVQFNWQLLGQIHPIDLDFITFSLEGMGNNSAVNKDQPGRLFLVEPFCNADVENQIAVVVNTKINGYELSVR